jgi:hypothetical protein
MSLPPNPRVVLSSLKIGEQFYLVGHLDVFYIKLSEAVLCVNQNLVRRTLNPNTKVIKK